MNELIEMARAYNVSESAMVELFNGVQRRIASLPEVTRADMANDPEFGAYMMNKAILNYFADCQKQYNQYFSDDEYRAQVLADTEAYLLGKK